MLSGVMTARVLTVFLSYLTRFFKPVQELAKRTNAIAQTAVAVDRVQAILQTDEIIPERPNAPVPRSIRGEIVFDHVAFRYDKAPVLRDVSFRIEPGQFVGIVGPTGSGKSTIISLIPRFYDPPAEASGSMAWMFAIISCRVSGKTLLSCCRIPCCFAERSARISRMAVPKLPTARSFEPPSSPTPTNSSTRCPMATTRWSASEA